MGDTWLYMPVISAHGRRQEDQETNVILDYINIVSFRTAWAIQTLSERKEGRAGQW